jgi:hypothetical protein
MFSVAYMDAEAFDTRLRVTSKFLLFHLLHVNCDMSVYQSTGQCLYLSVLNLISQHHILIYINAYQ